jgi:hypothetical protein
MKILNLRAFSLVLTLFASVANADTDTVVVTGTVQSVLTISIAGGSPSFNITPEVAVTNQDLGTITINSNDPEGYDVTLKSTNTGGLKNVAADETIAYTVKYNSGGAITLTTTAQNVENVTTQTAGAVTRTLTLDITGPASLGRSAEAFTDTITMEILGK